jgi:hypothetical protein
MAAYGEISMAAVTPGGRATMARGAMEVIGYGP